MVGKGTIKFLKIFLNGKNTEHSVFFIWKIPFETLIICEVESIFWETLFYNFSSKFVSVITHRFLSLSFQVSHLLTSRLDSPMFSGPEKRPVLRNPGSKDSVSHVFNFIQLFHQIIYIFWIWNTFVSPEIYFWWYCIQIQKITEYWVLLVFTAKSSVSELAIRRLFSVC